MRRVVGFLSSLSLAVIVACNGTSGAGTTSSNEPAATPSSSSPTSGTPTTSSDPGGGVTINNTNTNGNTNTSGSSSSSGANGGSGSGSGAAAAGAQAGMVGGTASSGQGGQTPLPPTVNVTVPITVVNTSGSNSGSSSSSGSTSGAQAGAGAAAGAAAGNTSTTPPPNPASLTIELTDVDTSLEYVKVGVEAIAWFLAPARAPVLTRFTWPGQPAPCIPDPATSTFVRATIAEGNGASATVASGPATNANAAIALYQLAAGPVDTNEIVTDYDGQVGGVYLLTRDLEVKQYRGTVHKAYLPSCTGPDGVVYGVIQIAATPPGVLKRGEKHKIVVDVKNLLQKKSYDCSKDAAQNQSHPVSECDATVPADVSDSGSLRTYFDCTTQPLAAKGG